MNNTKVIIFHSPLADNAPADELDVLEQAAYFSKGLKDLGYEPEIISFSYNLLELKKIVEKAKPLFVVNLTETLFGDGRLVHVGPFLFDHMDVPYTGCTAHSIYLSSHKVLAKQHLLAHNIATPTFFTWQTLRAAEDTLINKPFIVKSLWEHASYGLDESKQLLFSTRKELINRLGTETRPEAFFCEEYIHGREFNLSILDSPTGPQVLPPAEIRFTYPEDKPRILGYKAKWDEESFEYKNTIRSFDFSDHDNQIISDLEKTALQCWKIFDLKGYARVDFRVDEQGNIFVLEINANPCISPDSGFVAAATMAGLNNCDVVRRIIPEI